MYKPVKRIKSVKKESEPMRKTIKDIYNIANNMKKRSEKIESFYDKKEALEELSNKQWLKENSA